jgi:hypothetical protein
MLAHALLGDFGWFWRAREAEASLRAIHDGPAMLFLPTPDDPGQPHAWWCFRPQAIRAMLGTLGFPRATVTHFRGPRYLGVPRELFTVVARRG